MSPLKRVAVLSLVFTAAVVLALAWQNPGRVSAHGVLDQTNLTGTGGGFEIDAWEPIGQTFTPSLTPLVAVDVHLTANPEGSPADITLRLRSGSIGGTILGSATRNVPAFLFPFGSAWLHFELPSPVSVTPGQTYVIELLSTNATHFWSVQGPGTYAGGGAIVFGQGPGTNDFLFRTYGREVLAIKGDVDCSGEVNAVDALKVLRHVAGLTVSQDQPCIEIGDPTDYRTSVPGL